MAEHGTSIVYDVIARHRFRAPVVRNTGMDASNSDSFLGWEDFVADVVFENIPKVVADDVELCKVVEPYVNSIRVDKGIPSDAARNGRSLLWFELLRKVGWLDEFLSNESVSEPLTDAEFKRLTAKWASETGMDWRKWFQLLCYLRSVKLKMITLASNNTLEELNPAVYERHLHYGVSQIASMFARTRIEILRVGVDAPFSEKKTTNEQWSRIQLMVLTMYNALPNAHNLIQLNFMAPVMVNGLSSNALRNYLSSFYYNVLALHSYSLSVGENMMANGDREFIEHMLSKDPLKYYLIAPEHSTQAYADVASAYYSAMEMVPSRFRMSETFIVNAFKNDRVGLLVPEGVDQLAELGIDSKELFNRVLEVVGARGEVKFKTEIRGNWDVWLDGHIETLRLKEFNEQKQVVASNPNTIVFFSFFDLIRLDEDVIGMLENVFKTEKLLAPAAANHALEILEGLYVGSHYGMPRNITRDQYIGFLLKYIKLKNHEAREHVLDAEGLTSGGVLKAIEGDSSILKTILTAILTSFPIADTVPPLVVAVSSMNNNWIEKEVAREVLKETNVFEIAYRDPQNHIDYEIALDAQSQGLIERAEAIEFISMALRTGRSWYHHDFRRLAFEDNIFTVQELSTLFAAERHENVSLLDSTFKVLYLAMSKAPEDTAFLIRNFLAVKFKSAAEERLHPEVFKADFTTSQMVVDFDDYILLKRLYLDLTQKPLFE